MTTQQHPPLAVVFDDRPALAFGRYDAGISFARRALGVLVEVFTDRQGRPVDRNGNVITFKERKQTRSLR